MKFQIGWLFIAAILFASCSGGIDSQYTKLQDKYSPVYDSTGKQVATELRLDTFYTLSPSFDQKVQITKKTGVFGWAIALMVVALVIILFGIVYSSNAGRFTSATVWIFVLALALLGGAFSLVDSAHIKQADIKKSTYDSLMKTPKGLEPFWDENLLK